MLDQFDIPHRCLKHTAKHSGRLHLVEVPIETVEVFDVMAVDVAGRVLEQSVHDVALRVQRVHDGRGRLQRESQDISATEQGRTSEETETETAVVTFVAQS